MTDNETQCMSFDVFSSFVIHEPALFASKPTDANSQSFSTSENRVLN